MFEDEHEDPLKFLELHAIIKIKNKKGQIPILFQFFP
jgi:hypothetical protein